MQEISGTLSVSVHGPSWRDLGFFRERNGGTPKASHREEEHADRSAGLG